MNKKQLRNLIDETLEEVGLYTPAALELLMGTAAVESALGFYWYQVDGDDDKWDGGIGIFQMEMATHDDLWENYLQYHPDTAAKVLKSLGIVDELYMWRGIQDDLRSAMKWNLQYQIIMARIHYLRVPKPLPHFADYLGQAVYWKNHYNTRLGKGTPSKYVAAYKKYVKGDMTNASI